MIELDWTGCVPLSCRSFSAKRAGNSDIIFKLFRMFRIQTDIFMPRSIHFFRAHICTIKLYHISDNNYGNNAIIMLRIAGIAAHRARILPGTVGYSEESYWPQVA